MKERWAEGEQKCMVCGMAEWWRSIRCSTINEQEPQQLLRWTTVSEQSGPKSGGCCASFRGGAGSLPI